MATQRISIAAIAGEGGVEVQARFQEWLEYPAQSCPAVDTFCSRLRSLGAWHLPVLYYSEWVDRWLMGDQIFGGEYASGDRYGLKCLTPDQALRIAEHPVLQFQEQTWLATRLRETVDGWGGMNLKFVVVVIREVLGPSITDEEVSASLKCIPDWLQMPSNL